MKGAAGSEAEMPRRVAIVGNAPEMADQSRRIDAADWVVRFNNAAGFGGRAGARVTHLALVNHGGQMREWLDDPGFLCRPAVSASRCFLFPFPRKEEPIATQGADGRDWTAEAEVRLRQLEAKIAVLPEAARRAAEAIVSSPGRTAVVPSTGLLVTIHLLALLPDTVRFDVHGFGFEGWSGHDWQAERRWFEAMRDAGRIELHALASSLPT